MKKCIKYISFAALGLLIIALCFVFINVDVADILIYSPESPLLASIALVGLFCLKSVVMVIPLMVLYVSAGIMFPLGWAVLIICIGLLLEMTIGYFIGKRLSIDGIKSRISKYKKVERVLPTKEEMTPSVCFAARFLPIPFDIVSMVQGAYGVKFPQYIGITYLGTLISGILYVHIGRHIATPLSKEFLIPLAIIVAITICPMVISMRRNRKKRTVTE